LLPLVKTDEVGTVRLVEGSPVSAQNLESCTCVPYFETGERDGLLRVLNINKES
jgi:hypothetical protein